MSSILASPKGISSAQAPVGLGFILVYTLAYFGVWMALLTPPVVSLALRVNEIDPANKETALSWILGLGAIVAMFANPIAGQLSDRTSSRLGMRRPWIVGGMAIGTAGLYVIATGTSVAWIAAGWCIAQLGFNAVLAAIVAVLPDQVPDEQRGRVSGALGICLQLGIVGGVYLTQAVSSTFAMFMLPCAIASVLIVLFILVLDDKRIKKSEVPPFDLIGFFRNFWIDPRKAPDFAWAFVSRFMLFIGLATLLTYQVFYLLDQLHYTGEQIPGAMLTSTLVTTATTVVGSFCSGWLSDRIGRRKVFVCASAFIYACGLAVIGLATDFQGFLWGIAIVGFGQGVYMAVDMALVTQVLPNKDADAAKDLGIFNLASALPQSVAPAIAPIFLSIGAGGDLKNYTALFVAAAVFATLGALSVLPIRAVK